MCVRHVSTNPINASEFVASVCRHSRIIFTHYTDAHDVDEDMPAIIRRGGDWGDSINAGLTQQSAYNTPSTSVPTVASKK